jgi:hypothetical protein
MLLHRTLATGLLMGLALLAAPSLLHAQEIHVSPNLFDYGDVTVGEAATQIFEIGNTGPGDVEISIVILTTAEEPVEYEGHDFTITMAPEFPAIIPGKGSREVEVTFSPTSADFFEVYLFVFSLSGYPSETYVPLTGMGVETPPPVDVAMAELIALYEASVADGTLVGYGCCDWLADKEKEAPTNRGAVVGWSA